MKEENTKNLISQYIKGISKRSMYRDIKYDPKGIDYTHFLKLRLTTFDNRHNFIEQFTPEGFHILWYLMTRGKQSIYINTSVNLLMQNLNMTKYKVTKGLKALKDSDVIEIHKISKENQQVYKVKTFDLNDSIHILIKYHDDNLYSLDDEKGYRAIPFDFIHRAIIDLTEKEFTLFMFLVARNRYYYIGEYVDEETGEIYNTVNDVGYSFPTQEQISDIIKVNRKDVNTYTDSLESKGYIKINKTYEKKIIKDKNTGKSKIKNMNFTYKVLLLNRFEYIKYHIVDIANEEIKTLSKELQKYINKTRLDDILIDCEGTNKLSLTIRNKLYLENKYGSEIQEYYVNYEKKECEE